MSGTGGSWGVRRRRLGVNYIMPLGCLGKGRGCPAQRHTGTTAGRLERSKGLEDIHFWSDPLIFFLGRTLG